MTPKVEQVPVPQLPQAPPPAPIFGQQPTGQKPGVKSATPSFLSSATVPTAGQKGQKQLVGQ